MGFVMIHTTEGRPYPPWQHRPATVRKFRQPMLFSHRLGISDQYTIRYKKSHHLRFKLCKVSGCVLHPLRLEEWKTEKKRDLSHTLREPK